MLGVLVEIGTRTNCIKKKKKNTVGTARSVRGNFRLAILFLTTLPSNMDYDGPGFHEGE